MNAVEAGHVGGVSPGKRNVYLLGFMAAGKTTVGRSLSRELGWEFIDVDEVIEQRAGRSIREIFREHGESFFRRLEKELIAEISARDGVVVALGGGSYVDEENRRLALATGTCVFLDTPLELIRTRLKDHDSRPLARGPDELSNLLTSRLPTYLDADLRVSGSGTPDEVVLAILAELRRSGRVR